MTEQRNIVVLGGSAAGLTAAHYILKHILPSLRSKKDAAKYHVYLLNPASDYYFRIAAPRIAASTSRLAAEKALFDIKDMFKGYKASEFTFLQATATGVDISTRTVAYKRNQLLDTETLVYHALIVATGTQTNEAVFSQHGDSASLISALSARNTEIAAAKSIIIGGGGPTAVEHAGEIGELLNGKPGWFGSTPSKKVSITLITGGSHLLPVLRPAIGKQAEHKLRKLGVDVVYNTRVTDSVINHDGRTTVTLSKGEKLDADLFIAAWGVSPNSSFLPPTLLTENGYLRTNSKTLRVDSAGPRVYALGDVGDYSRNNILDVYDALPALVTNLKRDLYAYDARYPDKKTAGKDREFVPNKKEMQIVPVGSGGGVGAVMGWKIPSFLVWAFKSRDMMLGMGAGPLVNGGTAKKEVVWTGEEIVRLV